MREALKGKIIVSILAGVTQRQISEFLYPEGPDKVEDACRVVRVMPNTASFVGESMSVIETSDPPLSDAQHKLVEFVFSSIGRVTTLPPANMDIATALCGSGPAFFALILEAAADGAVLHRHPGKIGHVRPAASGPDPTARCISGSGSV